VTLFLAEKTNSKLARICIVRFYSNSLIGRSLIMNLKIGLVIETSLINWGWLPNNGYRDIVKCYLKQTYGKNNEGIVKTISLLNAEILSFK